MWTEVLVGAVILTIIVGLLIPAVAAARKQYQAKQTATVTFTSADPKINPVRSVTQYTRFDALITVEHDGCWFVVTNDYNAAIIHHPKCPCLERQDDDPRLR